MKKFMLEFLRRGLVACGLGPIVLAVIYLVLERAVGLDTLTASQVSIGILSLAALAFLAGGLNALYQMERLPLMAAVSIHGITLYAGYLAVYLVNGWLQWGMTPLLVFTGIFLVGYLVIWAVIYAVIRQRTVRLNQLLARQQEGR
jgi:hypothetical protein